MKKQQLNELIYQALETEMGGVQVYATALECVLNDELREEWERYHQETIRHVEVMRELCEVAGLDPDQETPGRMVVRAKGKALVEAMRLARESGEPVEAELVAAECVV